eukprot:gene11640-34349_t
MSPGTAFHGGERKNAFLRLLWLALLSISCLAENQPCSSAGRGLLQSAGSVSIDISLDDPLQRAALEDLFISTGGPAWLVPQSTSNWKTNVTYCSWLGVTCCVESPFELVPCKLPNSVVALSLQSFGLSGSLPATFGQDLKELIAASFVDNPSLRGGLPNSLATMPHLLWMSVLGSSINACTDASQSDKLPRKNCQLLSSLQLSPDSTLSLASISCPAIMLTSFEAYTANMSTALKQIITLPYSAPVPGSVISDPAVFTGYYQCSCDDENSELVATKTGDLSCQTETSPDEDKYIVGIVLAAVLPLLLISLGVYIFVKHKATLHQLAKSREEEWKKKRARVPGTPGLLSNYGGRDRPDVMVTWVFTDVADSTRLWEWNADVMDRAIDLHNSTIRSIMDDYGGHEIRNEGDAFTVSFHDACDAVRFCLKWPSELLEHDSGCIITVGHLVNNSSLDSEGKGSIVMAGLRVRMGINTDQTGLVDYRGDEYDLAAEICDLAAGGQVLMGPKTFQRWNKLYGDVPDQMQKLVQDLYRAPLETTSMADRVSGRPSMVNLGGE